VGVPLYVTIHLYIYMFFYIYMYVYICIFIYLCICYIADDDILAKISHALIPIYTYIYIFVYVRIHLYIYIFIYIVHRRRRYPCCILELVRVNVGVHEGVRVYGCMCLRVGVYDHTCVYHSTRYPCKTPLIIRHFCGK